MGEWGKLALSAHHPKEARRNGEKRLDKCNRLQASFNNGISSV